MLKFMSNGKTKFIESIIRGKLLSSGSWQVIRKGESDGIIVDGIGYSDGEYNVRNVDDAEVMNNVTNNITENALVADITFVVLAENQQIDDVTCAEHASVFPSWVESAHYAVGNIRRYDANGKLYRCLTEHDSNATWTPDASPSLWVNISDPAEEYPEWSQPIASTDAYNMGDKVTHNGKKWTSDVDGNVWEPGVYGWTEVTE